MILPGAGLGRPTVKAAPNDTNSSTWNETMNRGIRVGHPNGAFGCLPGCVRAAAQWYDCTMNPPEDPTVPSRYPVPAGRHRVEQSIDRSRFLCTIQRVEDAAAAQAMVRAINLEFGDATHNCWAYVAGPPGSTNAIGMSDAGEPHGTAGRPMLTVLLHSGVGEIGAVVTRYYGGTKLGTGGLVKAYGGTVQLCLDRIPVTDRVDYANVTVSVGYSEITVVQQAIVALDVKVVREEYGVDVGYSLRVPRENVEKLRIAVADATRGMGQFHVADDGDPGGCNQTDFRFRRNDARR